MSPEAEKKEEKEPKKITIYTNKASLMSILIKEEAINEIPLTLRGGKTPCIQITLQKTEDQSWDKVEEWEFFTTNHALKHYLNLGENGNDRKTKEPAYIEYFFPIQKNLKELIGEYELYFKKLDCYSLQEQKKLPKKLKKIIDAFTKVRVIGFKEINPEES